MKVNIVRLTEPEVLVNTSFPNSGEYLLILDVPTEDRLKYFTQFSAYLPIILIGDEFIANEKSPVLPRQLSPEFLIYTYIQTKNQFTVQRDLTLAEELTVLYSDYSLEVVWTWNLHTNILQFNKESWLKTFGYPVEEDSISYEAWMQQVHPEDITRVHLYFKKLIESKSAIHFSLQYRMMSKSGYVPILERGKVHRRLNGHAYKITGTSENISEQIKNDHELQKLSKILKETHSGVVILNPQGHVTWLNNAFARMTGFTLEELKGKKPHELLRGPDTDPETLAYVDQKMVLGETFSCEVLNYTKDGNPIWFNIYFQPQFNHEGKLDGYFTIEHDITNEKLVQEQLTITDKVLKALLEKTTDGLAVVSESGTDVHLYSDNNLLGYEDTEYVRKHFMELVHPDDLGMLMNTFAKVKSVPDSIVSLEFRVYNNEGKYIWMECTIRNLLDDPIIKGIVINYRNINYRKEAETLIYKSNQRYQKLFNHNPLALFIWDPYDYKILDFNDSAVSIYGYTKEDFKHITIRDLIAEDRLERFDYICEKIRNGEYIGNGYISKNLTKSGKHIHVFVTFNPLELDGHPVYLTMVNNMTEQVMLEEKLAEERNKKQKEITHAVITAQEQERQHIGLELHDNINQILATSRLYIEYAITNDNMRPQMLNTAKGLISKAVNEIRNLSSSLLVNSIDSAGLVVSIKNMIDTMMKVNVFKMRTEWDFDENKLSAPLKLTIYRIIQEQLNNISKHAEANEVSISIVGDDNLLELSIKDDGKGFDVEGVQSGLGIKNIQSRASLHMGVVTLDSKPGSGTQLLVRFDLS